MGFLNRQGWGRTLLLLAVTAVAVPLLSGCDDKGTTPPTEYVVEVSSAGTGASGGGGYAAGTTVTISAGTAPAGQKFKNWTSSSSGVIFADANSATTTFIMPANAVTVTAVFEPQDGTSATYAVTVSSAGTGTIGGGSYAAGATVIISAGTAPTGQQFKNWTSTSNGVVFADEHNAMTTFVMPANAVTVTAVFEQQGVTPATYAVTVSSAGTGTIGGGSYAAGATVIISAGTAPSGQQFKNWTSTSNGVTFADEHNAATTFIMPANAVTVTAVFEPQVVTPTTYAVTVSSAGTGTVGGGNYAAGATVAISAGTAPAGQQFKNWASSINGVIFADANSAITTFVMPASAVTVTAVFEPQGATPTAYAVTVSSAAEDASGGGSYAAGSTVAISAGTAPEGQRFKNWTSTDGVAFGDASRAATAFIMPPKAVTVTAVFESITFVDIRDVSTYRTVKIAGKTWMAENLKYEPTTGSACYNGSADSCAKYGRLYDWNTAMANVASSEKNPSGVQGVCPTGWHLPSRAEWEGLAVAAGGIGTDGTSGTAGKALKATEGWNWNGTANGNGTDDYGFSALPGGQRHSEGTFRDAGNNGFWWTATAASADNAYLRKMNYSNEVVNNDSYSKKSMYSVRCVRDD